jgi:competence protein ComEC
MLLRVLFSSLLISLFFFSLSFLYYSKASEDCLRVSFLDVGQGDSILIESPAGQNIIIDGGPDSKVLYRLGEALPFWERNIDLLILTHPHSDHILGLLDVMERYDVDRVLHTGVDCHSSFCRQWQRLIDDKDIEAKIAQGGHTIELAQDCYLEIIYPFTPLQGSKVDNINNSSLVSRLDCRGVSFLFTGDIEGEVKNELVSSGADLEAGVLKLAHHGAGESGAGDFLHKVSPEVAVVSVGDNDYGHPGQSYLQELKNKGVMVLRTDRQGTIVFTKDDDRADIEFGSAGIGIKDIFY